MTTQSKLVNVLISTYNGEKYIREQIDSILNQSYQNIRIYVRDDGSTDHTIEILKEYQKNDLIEFIQGENIRWGRSFLTLLQKSELGDYWAFSDQDDIWFKDKIQWAVDWLEQQDQNVPCLYHASYAMMNHDLSEKIGECHSPNYAFDFQRAITDCLYQGFSIVINKSLRDLMLKGNINNISSHDWWACLLVTEFGKSYYDDRISSYHRRLDTSMSGGGLKGKIKWFKSVMQNQDSDINNCAREYINTFSNQTKKKDLDVIKLFVYDSYSLSKSLKKCLFPKRWRPGIVSEMSIRLLMLLGKI